MMLWLLAMLVAVSPDLEGYGLPHRDSRATVQAVTGNGRITAGIDGVGGLVQLRWPTLGYWDHLPADDGARWLFRDKGTLAGFTEERWEIRQEAPADGGLVTRFSERTGSRLATQRLYVAAQTDLVVIELELDGFSPETALYWYQHLAPSTTLVPGVPDGYVHLDQLRGFATCADANSDMLVQFRPEAPGRADWEQSRAQAATTATDGRDAAFDDGAYWGTFSPTGSTKTHFGPVRHGVESLLGREPNVPWVAGDAHAALRMAPEAIDGNRQRFVICLAAANSAASLETIRSDVAGAGLPAAATFPPAIGAEGTPAAGLAALMACIDSASGAVVRAPLSVPPLAHAAVFDSAWASAALGTWAYHREAEGILGFHLATVREGYSPDGAPGSLPAYVYTTGQPARFLDGANPAATAWLLAAVWHHVASASPEQTGPFLEQWDVALIDCGDFLARAPLVGGVLAGILKPQAVPLPALQTHYLGLVSARSIQDHLGREEPDPWRSRREESYARIRFRQLDAAGTDREESAWLDRWVAALPEGAISNDGAWEVLRREGDLPADEELLPQCGPLGVAPGIPVALRAALAALALE